MLLVLASAAWLAVTFFGLAVLRLAALSDDWHALALAEWIAAARVLQPQATEAESWMRQLPVDPPDEAYRAAG